MNVYFTTSPIHIGQTLKLVTYNEPKLYKTKPNQTNETAITENLEHLLPSSYHFSCNEIDFPRPGQHVTNLHHGAVFI